MKKDNHQVGKTIFMKSCQRNLKNKNNKKAKNEWRFTEWMNWRCKRELITTWDNDDKTDSASKYQSANFHQAPNCLGTRSSPGKLLRNRAGLTLEKSMTNTQVLRFLTTAPSVKEQTSTSLYHVPELILKVFLYTWLLIPISVKVTTILYILVINIIVIIAKFPQY